VARPIKWGITPVLEPRKKTVFYVIRLWCACHQTRLQWINSVMLQKLQYKTVHSSL